MKLSKRMLVISLIVLALVGSLFTAYASNNLFSDVANFAVDTNVTLVASLPMTALAAMVIAYFFFILRHYKNPKCLKRMGRLYLILLVAFNGVGLVSTIVSGAAVYHSFTKPYPFPGFLIIMLVVHALFLAAHILGLFMVSRLPEDEERIKPSPKHVFATLGWVCFTILVFNRLGTLLMFPLYVQWRTLYMTFPAYVFLLMGLCIGVFKLIHDLEIVTCKKALIITASVLIGTNVALFVVTLALGLTDTTFISAVSVLFPLERLASKPLELPIHFAAYIAVLVVTLVQTCKSK